MPILNMHVVAILSTAIWIAVTVQFNYLDGYGHKENTREVLTKQLLVCETLR